MAKQSFLSQLKRVLVPTRRNRNRGFTFLELLVVTLIAAGIVSGLVYLVVELMGADQREASRNDTQRELQMAMDYIANEMREAVYVYTGECLQGQGTIGVATPPFCPGLVNHLPPALAGNGRSIPIVAFWKQEPIPAAVSTRCSNAATAVGLPCLTAHSYALVVYSLSKTNVNNFWKGRARITRYILSEFDSTGNRVTGYVNPADASNFEAWPYGPTANSGLVNLQGGSRPTGNPAVLIDFVDDGTGAAATGIANLATSARCPDNPATSFVDYSLSPPTTMLATYAFTNARSSFYACVSTARSTNPAVNQDSMVFIRANAYGRPGISTDRAFLPSLETRVLSRGVLDRVPPQ